MGCTNSSGDTNSSGVPSCPEALCCCRACFQSIRVADALLLQQEEAPASCKAASVAAASSVPRADTLKELPAAAAANLTDAPLTCL